MNENPSPLPKEELYKNILTKEFKNGAVPDAIFVLSGGVELHPKRGYRSPSYGGADFTGLITGGRARVIAGAEISKSFPEITMVTTSRGQEDRPTDAEIMAQELEDRGVDSGNVELEEESTSTLTELIQMIKIAEEKEWSKVAVLTNGYHVPRVKVMYDKLESIEGLCDDAEVSSIRRFKEGGAEVSFVSAEDIMVNISPHYKNLIDKVEQSEGYKERLELEREGVEDLLAGRYKLRRQHE